jgi:Xaa-Pro aminopeptidase
MSSSPERSNRERVERLRDALTEANLDALACTTPTEALLVSGYWPIIGNAVAVVTRDGVVVVAAPEDEGDLAERGWADDVVTFRPGSLDQIVSTPEVVCETMKAVGAKHGLGHARIGYQAGTSSQPSSYAAMFQYGPATAPLLRAAIPGATLIAADDLLARQRCVKTAYEIERIRGACRIAAMAYDEGRLRLGGSGAKETEAADLFRGPLKMDGTGLDSIQRADGYVYCMSGPNSAKAYAAHQRSTARGIERGDLLLVHCNSYADGYWTDITRTYAIETTNDRQRAMLEAVWAARAAALEAIRPGARAADVDRAARDELTRRRFGREFLHPTGHGVGFAAIDHNACPRLHPKSDDVLETGMVFNVEPGIYFERWGGMRHCDMIALTESGPEVLTPFHTDHDSFVLT